MNNDRPSEQGDPWRPHFAAMAEKVAMYYAELRRRDIPDDLARQLILDWHAAAIGAPKTPTRVASAITYNVNRAQRD